MSPNWPDYVKPEDMSIGFLWTNFAGFVLPKDASDVQRNETRNAFYAGFFEAFKVLNDYASALPEKEAVKLLERLAKENQEFYEKMKKEHGL